MESVTLSNESHIPGMGKRLLSLSRARHCNTLQHTATCCNTLQHAAAQDSLSWWLTSKPLESMICRGLVALIIFRWLIELMIFWWLIASMIFRWLSALLMEFHSVRWWWKWLSVFVKRMSYCVCGDDDSSSLLQHTTTRCNTLQWKWLSVFVKRMSYCVCDDNDSSSPLQHTTTRCNTLQHTATHDYVSSRWRWLSALVTDWVISMTHCARKVGESLSSWCKWLSAFVTHTCDSNHTTQTRLGCRLERAARVLDRKALQHTATHRNTLQHTATHYNTLHHTAKYCNTLQHTATHCNTLQHTATHCNTLHHTD